MVDVPFWNKEGETAERSRIEQIQLQRLRQTIGWALQTPFYRKRLSQVGINAPEDVRSLQDLRRIPYTTKDDLRLSFPKGLLSVDMAEVIRIHSSSGTTGIPTVIYFARDDLDNWTDLLDRSIVGTGGAGRAREARAAPGVPRGRAPPLENPRRKLQDLLRIDAYNSYGLSELNGPGVAFECVCKKDMHIWEDAYIAEVIDPQTGEALPAGEQGELVL